MNFSAMIDSQQRNVDDAELASFATELGVTPASLKKLGIGHDGEAWTFPERNSDGEIIGIARRLAGSKKSMMTGSKRGLMMPLPIDPYDGTSALNPMLVVEGPSDAAAGLDLGFLAVGRPSATGGLEHLKQIAVGRHVVIVGENDDAGRAGAEKIADGLVDVAEQVKVVFPPQESKDLREWKTASAGCDRKEVLAAIAAAEVFTDETKVVVADHNWPDPKPLPGDADPPAFPIETAFGPSLEPVAQYLRAVAEALQVPVDMPAMQLLPIVATAIAKKVEVGIKPDWRETPAIWTLVLLESGNRKSASFTRLLRPLIDWERNEADRLGPIIAEQKEREKIRKAKQDELRRRAAKDGQTGEDASMKLVELAREDTERPVESLPRLVSMEPTTEAVAGLLVANRERLLVAAAEADSLDVILGRYSAGKANFGVWLSGHSGDPYRVDRRGREPDHLKRPVLSVSLSVQPEAVEALFASRQAQGRGMIARFLSAAPKSLLGARKIDPKPIPKELSAKYSGAIRRMLDMPIGDSPTIIRLDSEAAELFDEFRKYVEVELAPSGKLADCTAWGGKLCGAVARIALSLHALSQWGYSANCGDDSTCISKITMAAALTWASYLIDHQIIVNGVVGSNEDVFKAKRVLRWLSMTGDASFNRRNAFTSCRSSQIKVVEDIDPALELLVDYGYIALEAAHSSDGPGRKPSPVYSVSPSWQRK